ncbi:hypothetical protein MHI32_11950 [Paenibacillus sp. FSL H7-0690]|uniref:hypothetical protein n=1 Tax=Paenibacillus sp. FSL H7-0690 TaxID=2921437 RepID=UPI0030EE4BC7
MAYGVEFDYVNTNREVTDDEFLEVFEQNRITFMRVKLYPQGSLLRDIAEIFLDEEVNRFWIDSWNADESETHEMVLKAPGRGGAGDLRRSPIANSLINLPVKKFWNLITGVMKMGLGVCPVPI